MRPCKEEQAGARLWQSLGWGKFAVCQSTLWVVGLYRQQWMVPGSDNLILESSQLKRYKLLMNSSQQRPGQLRLHRQEGH